MVNGYHAFCYVSNRYGLIRVVALSEYIRSHSLHVFSCSSEEWKWEHLLYNRLANVGPKGLTEMLEPRKAARQTTTKGTTPPAEVTHYIAFYVSKWFRV